MLAGTLASTLGYVGVISKLDAPVLKPEAADSLKVGLPILNMGLPKSGDTTLLDMFSCAGLKVSHYHCKRPSIDAEPYPTAAAVSAKCQSEKACRCKVFGNCTGTGLTTEPTDAFPLHNPFHYCRTYGMCDNEDLPKHLCPPGFENITHKDPYCGSCIMNNVLNEERPSRAAATSDVFAQLDGPWQEGNASCRRSSLSTSCTTPTPMPPCCCPRGRAKWVKSHAMQRGSEMRQYLSACNLPTCGPACVDSDNLFAAFYNEHALAIRTFAKNAATALIEIDVEAEDAGEKLANATGVKSSCWGQQNCKASCNFWHEMSNQRAATEKVEEKVEADKPSTASAAERAAETKAADKAPEKAEEKEKDKEKEKVEETIAEKAEKIVRPKVMTEGTPKEEETPSPMSTARRLLVPGTPGYEATPYVQPAVPGTPSFEPAAAAPAAASTRRRRGARRRVATAAPRRARRPSARLRARPRGACGARDPGLGLLARGGGEGRREHEP